MSRRTGALKHVHRYMKTDPKLQRGGSVWRCTLPGCTHYMPHNVSVLGCKSICWECGQIFVMEEGNLESTMPKCVSCAGELQETPGEMNALMEMIRQDEARAAIARSRNKPKEEVTDEEIEWYYTLNS